MKKHIVVFGTLLSLFGNPLIAAELKDLRQAEKIALTLTGQPLPDELRRGFLSGSISLETIADTLSKHPDFIEHYALYWSRTIGFTLPFNAYELREVNTNESFSSINFRQYAEGFYAQYAASYNKEDMARKAKAMSGGLQLSLRECDDGPVLFVSSNPESQANVKRAVAEGIGPDGNPILEGTAPYWAEIAPIYERGDLPCGHKDLKTVTPWWDPDGVTINSKYLGQKTYFITELALQHCGPDVRLCNTTALRRHDRYTDTFNKDLMMEPGYILAHTVAGDRPFSEALTTTDTIMTGSYGAWMTSHGNKLWNNYPKGTIDDINHKIFKDPKPTDRNHYRIKRNAMHAGLLTTPAFQLLTNGRRAKANKVYETFLCRKFVVPEGAKPNPADANPDLTKRAYCKYCHKSLEPMAAFFNGWPTTGANNYFYDNKNVDLDDSGRFNGYSGKGVPAFAKIITEAEPFAECTVKRTFEFVNGRKMSAGEAEAVPKLVDELKASNYNVRKLINSMVLQKTFLSPEPKQ